MRGWSNAGKEMQQFISLSLFWELGRAEILQTRTSKSMHPQTVAGYNNHRNNLCKSQARLAKV